MFQGKEIIEYYLRELEEEGVTHIPRWTPPVVSGTARLQQLPPSAARAIPAKGAKTGLDSKDPCCSTEQLVGSPDGECFTQESQLIQPQLESAVILNDACVIHISPLY